MYYLCDRHSLMLDCMTLKVGTDYQGKEGLSWQSLLIRTGLKARSYSGWKASVQHNMSCFICSKTILSSCKLLKKKMRFRPADKTEFSEPSICKNIKLFVKKKKRFEILELILTTVQHLCPHVTQGRILVWKQWSSTWNVLHVLILKYSVKFERELAMPLPLTCCQFYFQQESDEENDLLY